MIWEMVRAAGAKLLKLPPPGRYVQVEMTDRHKYGPLGSITPEELSDIIDAANRGDITRLMRAAVDIEGVNWDVQTAMATRRDSVSGCPYEFCPASDDPVAVDLAKRLSDEIKIAGLGVDGTFEKTDGTFDKMLRHSESAVIAPFAASEIIWTPGGGIGGFKPLEGWHFNAINSVDIRLITTDHPEGIELTPHKFLIHRLGQTVDIVTDGKIRALAWLHVFQNYPIKDLTAFVERYGMPFVVARVNEQTWEKDRSLIKSLIRNFGPSGGGVFSKAVEFELLQAANNTGDVYFKLLEYTGAAITKVLLGQLASSAVSSGLSGGDAQSRVRQDILEADARALESSINSQLILPWTLWHGGRVDQMPTFTIRTDPPEDAKANAEVVNILETAGYETDPDEVAKKCGFKKLTRKPPQVMNPGGALPDYGYGGDPNAVALAAEVSELASKRMVDNWLGAFAADFNDLAKAENLSEEEFKNRMETLLDKPPIREDIFAAALQREMMAGVLAGTRRVRRDRG